MNGSNQALGVELRHVFNRRWEIVGRETAGTTTRPFGGFTAPSYVTPDTGSVPTTEIYNSRVYYTQTSAYATYTRSSRSIFTVGGGGFFTYRTNEALVNTNSGYALGSWQYRVSRNNAVGTQYYYQKLSYPRAFGASDVNTIGATFQRVLGRYSNFYLLAGMSRAETLGSENYQLSPEISAILGVPTGVRILYRIDYIPTVNASLTYRKRFWGYNTGYNHGIGAGNGVYLTSVHDEGSIGASYSGFRRLAFGTNVSYRRMSSLWQTAEPFQYFTAGGGLSYAFGNGLNLVGQVDWRRMLAGTAINNQRGVVATLGISYSSRTIPLSLW